MNTDQDQPPQHQAVYQLTLCDRNGERIVTIDEVPTNPHYIHLYDDHTDVELSDTIHPDLSGPANTYERAVTIDSNVLYIEATP